MNNLDQFYTNKNIAVELFSLIKQNINLNEYFLFEPSAGYGAFSDLFEDNFIAIDIEPKKDYIQKQDFLTYNTDFLEDFKVVTIGNPPFGKNSSLALKFLNKCASFSDYICFILPKTFNKDSIINRIDLNLHLILNHDLPKNSFTYNNKNYDVQCVFQIWKKENYKRSIINKSINSKYFKFTTPDNADFAIRRVGALAGKVIVNYEQYKPSSHYYIKLLNNVFIEDFIELYNDFNEISKNTSGNPSLSKKELIYILEKRIKNK